jgi:hypothetical protein
LTFNLDDLMREERTRGRAAGGSESQREAVSALLDAFIATQQSKDLIASVARRALLDPRDLTAEARERLAADVRTLQTLKPPPAKPNGGVS